MENTSSPSKMPLISLGIVTVIVASIAVAFGLLYFNEKNKTATLVVTKSDQVQTNTATELPPKIDLLTVDQAKEKYKTSDKDKDITYTAKVGKFSLKLPSSLGIVQSVDGAGEGSVETQISIGKRTGSLISYSSAQPFSMRAIQVDDTILSAAKAAAKNTEQGTLHELLKQYGVLTDGDVLESQNGTSTKLGTLPATSFATTPNMLDVNYITALKGNILYVAAYSVSDGSEKEILSLVNSGITIE